MTPSTVDTTHGEDKVSILNFAVPWAKRPVPLLGGTRRQFGGPWEARANLLSTQGTVSIDPHNGVREGFHPRPRARVVGALHLLSGRRPWRPHSSLPPGVFPWMDDMAGTYDTNDITGGTPRRMSHGYLQGSPTSAVRERPSGGLQRVSLGPSTSTSTTGTTGRSYQSSWSKWEIEEGSTILKRGHRELPRCSCWFANEDGPDLPSNAFPSDPAYTDPGRRIRHPPGPQGSTATTSALSAMTRRRILRPSTLPYEG